MEAPTVSDGQVTLRPRTDDDTDSQVRPDAAAWRAGGSRPLAVDLEGRYAGQVSLRPTGPGAAAIDFHLRPWARGRGAMSAAVRLYLRWAFATAGWGGLDDRLEVVHWQAPVGSWSARRVIWACGFTVEGRVRALVEERGGRRDGWVGSVCSGDALVAVHPWVEVPVVDTGDVVLRPYALDDVPRITQACSDPGTRAWLPMLPSPYTEADAREFVLGREEVHSRGDGLHWAVTRPADGVLLGALGISDLHGGASRSAEIGYWTHPDSRGRGVMTAAVRAASRHCLLPVGDGGLGLARVLVRAAEANAASRRVAEKAGYTAVGRDRRAERLPDGRVVDFVRYDLLADELDGAWADTLAHPSALR